MPMWYSRDGDDLLIVTGSGSRKHHNLIRDGRVGVVVDRRQLPYYALMIQGRAEADVTGVADVRSQLAKRYLSADEATAFLKSRRDAPSVVYRIIAAKVSEYGALATA